jgi:hypothetical protein
MKLSDLHFSPRPLCLVPLRQKWPPQHPVFKHKIFHRINQQKHSIKYNKTQNIKYNSWQKSAPTCFGTGVPSSGSLVEQRSSRRLPEMAFLSLNMYELNICHALYFTICNLLTGWYVDCKNMHRMSNTKFTTYLFWSRPFSDHVLNKTGKRRHRHRIRHITDITNSSYVFRS